MEKAYLICTTQISNWLLKREIDGRKSSRKSKLEHRSREYCSRKSFWLEFDFRCRFFMMIFAFLFPTLRVIYTQKNHHEFLHEKPTTKIKFKPKWFLWTMFALTVLQFWFSRWFLWRFSYVYKLRFILQMVGIRFLMSHPVQTKPNNISCSV